MAYGPINPNDFANPRDYAAAIRKRKSPGAFFSGDDGGGTALGVKPPPAAKKGSSDYYSGLVDDAIGAYGGESFRLRDLEETRGAETLDYLKDEAAKASKPSMTDQDVSLFESKAGDVAGSTFLHNMASVREYLGGANITGGGVASGLVLNAEMQRLGQNLDARRDAQIRKIASDAADRTRNFQNAALVAAQMNRPVAMEGADFLNQLTQVRYGQQGLATEKEAAKDSAKASKKASDNGLFGDLISGGLGLLSGGLFG